MAKDYELDEDIEAMPLNQLVEYADERAKKIVHNTQGDSCDDPEEWLIEAVELAHAFYRMRRDGLIK